MKRILLFVLAVFLLTGCTQKETITQMDMSKVNGELKDAIAPYLEENGNYLLSDGKGYYVFLNRGNKMDGEEAVELKNFNIDVNNEVLTISFDEDFTDTSTEETDHQLLYKINEEDQYDTIDIVSNGEQSHFDHSISF